MKTKILILLLLALAPLELLAQAAWYYCPRCGQNFTDTDISRHQQNCEYWQSVKDKTFDPRTSTVPQGYSRSVQPADGGIYKVVVTQTGSSAASSNNRNSQNIQSAQQALGTALNLLQAFADSQQSDTPASVPSKEEEQKRQQAMDDAVAKRKQLDEEIKRFEGFEGQLDGLGQDTMAQLKAQLEQIKADAQSSNAGQKQKPPEQKPKLSPEEEARLNDFNKFTTDSPDKYSATNNYNQHVVTWDKEAPTRRDGENDWDYQKRKQAYSDRKLSEKTFEQYKKEAIEDRKKFEQKIKNEIDEQFANRNSPKATDGK